MFFAVVFSLEIIRNLVSNSVETCLERKSTLRRCVWEIFGGLSDINSQSSLVHASIAHLKRDVSRLLLSYIYGYRSVKSESKVTVNCADKTFLNESLPTGDRILAGKLVIISKILQNVTKPEDAVLFCLQRLQVLHEVYLLLVKETETSVLERGKLTKCVLNINKILFRFVRMFFKPPPTVEEWPATINLDETIYNPLIDGRFLKERLIGGDKEVSTGENLDISEDGVDNPAAPIIETLSDRYM